MGFHGVTLVAQAAHIPDPSGGATVDAGARAAINAILVVLDEKEIMAVISQDTRSNARARP